MLPVLQVKLVIGLDVVLLNFGSRKPNQASLSDISGDRIKELVYYLTGVSRAHCRS